MDEPNLEGLSAPGGTMAEIRTLQEVKNSMRRVFATAAGLPDPMVITDDSNLYDPPPPAGDLAFAPPPAPAMTSLLTLASRTLLGNKVATEFASHLLPPDMTDFTTFGPLARAVHSRVNDLAERALFRSICRALEADPRTVSLNTKIKHPDVPGAQAFARRLSDEVASGVCSRSDFALTPAQLQDAAEDMTIREAIKLLGDIIAEGGCL
jgi:hypothetical protein